MLARYLPQSLVGDNRQIVEVNTLGNAEHLVYHDLTRFDMDHSHMYREDGLHHFILRGLDVAVFAILSK